MRDSSAAQFVSVKLSKQLNAGSAEVTMQQPAGAVVLVRVVLDTVVDVAVVVVEPCGHTAGRSTQAAPRASVVPADTIRFSRLLHSAADSSSTQISCGS